MLMEIHGIQKMTLLDYPGHVACTLFFAGCDFRCPFCHNYELACGRAEPVMDEEGLLAFLKKRVGLIDGVVFTGGEPALWPGLLRLAAEIKSLGYLVKLDTNGYHPETLDKLISSGNIDYVAMDIKGSPLKYAAVCGVDPERFEFERIKKSIRLIMDSAPDYEFRTTVVGGIHEKEDFEFVGELIRGAKRYFLQAFEDRDTVPFSGFKTPDKVQILACAELARPFVQQIEIRNI